MPHTDGSVIERTHPIIDAVIGALEPHPHEVFGLKIGGLAEVRGALLSYRDAQERAVAIAQLSTFAAFLKKRFGAITAATLLAGCCLDVEKQD